MTTAQHTDAQPELQKMTPSRAQFFMERFKREEKLLGPNEQAALDFVIALLEPMPAAPCPTWQDAERIADLHNVDAAIRALLDDQTADNATGAVLAVLQAARAEAPPAEPAAPLMANGLTEAETRETASVAGLVQRVDGYGGVADLRDAKWLDPQCAHRGACQSLIFKAAQPPSAPMPAPRVPLTLAQLDDAARALAVEMDYPWDFMPTKGRDNMRIAARRILAAVGITSTPAPQPKEQGQ